MLCEPRSWDRRHSCLDAQKETVCLSGGHHSWKVALRHPTLTTTAFETWLYGPFALKAQTSKDLTRVKKWTHVEEELQVLTVQGLTYFRVLTVDHEASFAVCPVSESASSLSRFTAEPVIACRWNLWHVWCFTGSWLLELWLLCHLASSPSSFLDLKIKNIGMPSPSTHCDPNIVVHTILKFKSICCPLQIWTLHYWMHQ